MFGRDKKWILTYFPAAWLGHICQGLAMGIMGPAQPYLAAMVGVTNEEINLIWTLRALGSCLATLLTGMVFKKYIKKQSMKLAFLGLSVVLVGVFMGLVPWTSSFYVLLLTIMIVGVFLGSFYTASNSLVLYMLGPSRSPPFTQSLHAMVALGFMLGSLVIRPFLPDNQAPENNDNSDVCQSFTQNGTKIRNWSTDNFDNSGDEVLVETDIQYDDKYPNLLWPFSIIFLVHTLSAVIYFSLILFGIPMPRFHKEVNQVDAGEAIPKQCTKKKYSGAILFLAFFSFAFSCGIEGFFQSQTFTFGICGPHRLHPKRAAILTTVYFVCFLFGRFTGVPLSSRLKPRTLLMMSIIGVMFSGFILSITAAKSVILLYCGTGSVGFFVSLQFSSGYSWLSEQVDLTGNGSSVVFLGTNIGWLVFPPLAGLVFFSSVGPMGVFYLTLAISSAHLLVFLGLLQLSRM